MPLALSPVAGVRDFVSNLRYSTEGETSLLNFPFGSRGSDQKFAVIR